MGNNKTLLAIIAVLLLGILVVLASNAHRTPGEKISDGMHEVGQGLSDTVNRATH